MKLRLLGYAALSGLLLGLSWPHVGYSALIFIALVPLLKAEHESFAYPEKFSVGFVFVYSYCAFLIWNLITTWWVYNASAGGAAMAILCNALLMAITFTIYHIVRRKFGMVKGYWLLPFFWLTFEFLHLDWDLSWPWLTLGNVFAENYRWVQWYEYTGVFGGGWWIFIVNILFFECYQKYASGYKIEALRKQFLIPLLLIVIPVSISYIIYASYEEDNSKSASIVVVQPNIDPYNEKFNGLSPEEQLSSMLNLAAQKTDKATDLIILPETAIIESLWENDLTRNFSLSMCRSFIQNLPEVAMITGASTYKAYENPNEVTATSRRFPDQDKYYDAFNTALMISNKTTEVSVYHKSKLVPGVEKMPFPVLFKPLEDLAIDLGGTSGSLAGQDERTIMSHGKIKVAPIICYESVYGEYVTEYVRNGANLLCIITNDGWWGDTPGYKQHKDYARLRAIETRRSIARSANTGISCFIDQKGDTHQDSGWWVSAVIKERLNLSDTKTFYVRFGDYLAWIAVAGVIFSIVLLIAKPIINRRKHE